MQLDVEIIRESEDRLSRKRWRFYTIHDTDVVLDFYATETRKTTRHHYRHVASWERIGRREYENLSPNVFEVPQEVIDEAVEKIRAQLKYVPIEDKKTLI